MSLEGIEDYKARDKHVITLGFSSYERYLASPLWKGIRDRVLSSRSQCRICKELAEQVHHTSYDLKTLSGEDSRHLVPLCRRCHQEIEFSMKRGIPKKRGFWSALHYYLRKVDPANTPSKKKGGIRRMMKTAFCSCGRNARKGHKLCRPCAKKAAHPPEAPCLFEGPPS